jgi:hypothetical protein
MRIGCSLIIYADLGSYELLGGGVEQSRRPREEYARLDDQEKCMWHQMKREVCAWGGRVL